MLLLTEKNAGDVAEIIRFFNHRGQPFFGGIFPGLIYGDKRLEEGGVLKKFKAAPPFMVRHLSSRRLHGLDLARIADDWSGKPTAMLFVDGLTTHINHFLYTLNNQIGDRASFLGGGAGSLSLKQQPCVFSNEGFFQDAAVCCILENEVRLGVRHGWKKLEGPFVATKTDGNTILQLNWENAFELYRRTVAQDAGVEIRQDNFFDIAKSYPFGMFRENEEDIVRDPLAVNDSGHLVCVGEVPSNTVLNILKGEPAALISAAAQALADCRARPGPSGSAATMIVDCISRALFLEGSFREELLAVRSQLAITHPQQEPFGILSLGEISSYGDGLLEFFNKTIVVGTL